QLPFPTAVILDCGFGRNTLVSAAVRLCASDWTKQETQDDSGSLGGDFPRLLYFCEPMPARRFTPLSSRRAVLTPRAPCERPSWWRPPLSATRPAPYRA